jgi:hypothetical protein
MKRLDQGHLHPKLEVSRLNVTAGNTAEPGPPRWEASPLEESHSNSLFNCYSGARTGAGVAVVRFFGSAEPEEIFTAPQHCVELD